MVRKVRKLLPRPVSAAEPVWAIAEAAVVEAAAAPVPEVEEMLLA
jgi:hypothetical protein